MSAGTVDAAPIDVVLFDLGGVLIELGGVTSMRELTGMASDDELWARWLACPWVRSFERGDCAPDEFAAGMVEEWGLTVAPEVFLAAFADWPKRPLPGAESLVAATRRRVPVGCLSNTNAMHWNDRFARWPILAEFDFRFLSFELGVLKPDREVFDRVAARLPAAPERILFLDDNLPNVQGAIDAGFVAHHVRGVDEARAALVAAGILSPA